jgi:hypothetical protein
MERMTEVLGGRGRARRPRASGVVQSTSHHHTLLIGLLYAITIMMVIALAAKLH